MEHAAYGFGHISLGVPFALGALIFGGDAQAGGTTTPCVTRRTCVSGSKASKCEAHKLKLHGREKHPSHVACL
jgi:hypothetical protein